MIEENDTEGFNEFFQLKDYSDLTSLNLLNLISFLNSTKN